MKLSKAALVTDNIYDYALAASAHRQVSTEHGFAASYPILIPAERLRVLEPIFNYYGATPVDFASLFRSEGIAGRSEEALSLFPCKKTDAIRISTEGSSAHISLALLQSLVENRPLLFVKPSDFVEERFDRVLSSGRTAHIIISRASSALSIPAAFYAFASAKRLCLVDNLSDLDDLIPQEAISSVVLVDDFNVFNKSFLDTLLWWQQDSAAPAMLGILTAYSISEFSALIWRLTIRRDFQRDGYGLAEPTEVSGIPLKELQPTEYCILGKHGNEMHARHGSNDVICGAFRTEFRGLGSNGFNCEPTCPYENRIRSSEIPVSTVVIPSCDAFTLGEGLAPSEFTMLLNFLNGWSTSVIAPFKHVVINPGMALLADALVRSGYSLGEITQRLNSVARPGSEPDRVFALIGDPELVVFEPGRAIAPVTHLSRTDDEVQVECLHSGGPLLECAIPLEAIEHLWEGRQAMAVDPISDELCNVDTYFAFRPRPQVQQLGILIFGKQALPRKLLRFRLRRAHGLSKPLNQRAQALLRTISALSIFGIDALRLLEEREKILLQLRAVASYPRLPEFILSDRFARDLDSFVNQRIKEIRHSVVAELLQLTEDRLWLSHKYAGVYPLLSMLAQDRTGQSCPACGSPIYCWRYEDNCTEYQSRDVVICARCGIIADHPSAKELDVQIEQAIPVTGGDKNRHTMVVRNLSDRRIEFSIFSQYNQWKGLGITVNPVMQDIVLQPRAAERWEVEFGFNNRLPDNLLEQHVFLLTEQFDLYCFTGRRLSSHGKPSLRSH